MSDSAANTRITTVNCHEVRQNTGSGQTVMKLPLSVVSGVGMNHGTEDFLFALISPGDVFVTVQAANMPQLLRLLRWNKESN